MYDVTMACKTKFYHILHSRTTFKILELHSPNKNSLKKPSEGFTLECVMGKVFACVRREPAEHEGPQHTRPHDGEKTKEKTKRNSM